MEAAIFSGGFLINERFISSLLNTRINFQKGIEEVFTVVFNT